MKKSIEIKNSDNKSYDWSLFSRYRGVIFGISIISIMIYHFFDSVLAYDPSGFWAPIGRAYITTFRIGSIGVEWFLFLSGIGLYYSMKRNQRVSIFYRNRAKRIILPYILIAGLYFLFKDIVILDGTFSLFCKEMSFVTFFQYGTKTYWYVLFIIVAYAIYPLIFLFLEKLRMPDAVKLFILMVAGFSIIVFSHHYYPLLFERTEIFLQRWLVFFIGCWCAKRVYNKKSFGIADIIFLNTGLIIGLIFRLIPSVYKAYIGMFNSRLFTCFWSISALFYLVLLINLLQCTRLNKIFTLIGRASFELFLTHVAFRSIAKLVGLDIADFKVFCLYILASVIATMLVVALEKKCLPHILHVTLPTEKGEAI